jgi:hypothetical protein
MRYYFVRKAILETLSLKLFMKTTFDVSRRTPSERAEPVMLR